MAEAEAQAEDAAPKPRRKRAAPKKPEDPKDAPEAAE